MAGKSDPWDWTSDQVIDAFCRDHELLCFDTKGLVLPEARAFEALLRENDVHGRALLKDLTGDVLKDDFQIRSWGHRSDILWAVEQLRKQSAKYATYCASLSTSFLAIGGQTSTAGSYRTPQPHTPYPDFHRSGSRPNIHSPPLNYRQLVEPSSSHAHAEKGIFTDRPGIVDGNSVVVDGDHSPLHSHSTVNRKSTSVEGSDSSKRRLGVSVFRDDVGRKKRRLDLALVATQKPLGQAASVAETSLTSVSAANTSMSQGIGKTAKSGQQQPNRMMLTRAQLCDVQPGALSFLGRDKFSLDNIFFGETRLGHVLNEDVSMLPLAEDGSVPGEVFTFAAGGGKSAAGRQCLVNRKLMFFLGNRPELDVVANESMLAYYPLSDSPGLAPNTRSLICISASNGQLSTTRQKLPGVVAIQNGHDAGSASSNHDWDFLEHWQKETDNELPLYGESDSDLGSGLSSLEAELEADRAEDQEAVKHILTPNQVAAVMAEAMADQIRDFNEKQLPVLRDKHALSTWRKGRNIFERRFLANLALNSISKCDLNIEKIKAQIARDKWETKKSLQQQCESLEETIKQRERERFKMGIWQCATAPRAPTGRLRTRKRRYAHVTDENDTEHIVGSDEEVVDDRVELRDFVDVDNVKTLDLTSAPSTEVPADIMLQDGSTNDAPDFAIDEYLSEAQRRDSETGHSESGYDSVLGKQSTEKGVKDQEPDESIKEEPGARLGSRSKGKVPVLSEFIDLTFESDIDQDVATHSRQPRKSRFGNQSMQYSNHPQDDADEEVADWDFSHLEENEDRIRIVIKLVRTMPPTAYHRLRDYLLEDSDDTERQKIYEAGDNIYKLLRKEFGKLQDFEIAEFAYDRADELLHLYVCWLENSAEYFSVVGSREHFKLVVLDDDKLSGAYKQLNYDDAIDLLECLGVIHRTFSRHNNPLWHAQESDIEAREVNTDEGNQMTPRKRRKRQVAESQSAIQKRSRNQDMVKTWEDRSKLFLSQHQAQSSDLTPSKTEIVVNTGKEEDEDPILINPHIAGHLKAHQVDGIRFVWREVVGSASEVDAAQGCLLAHTMGLGKTVQVIAVITTLAHAAENQSTRDQIPKQLRKLRILILCPAGLLHNWSEEFTKWNKERFGIGAPFIINAQTPKNQRLELLDEWYRAGHGSVLLMSYELFRLWALNLKPAKREAPLTTEEYDEVKKKLLHGPSLVIADEAHKLKKHDSQVGKAAKLLKTTSRIALTGSPLSNNLTEYFAMVDWIAPDYLGDLVQFKANYIEPIEEGMYGDCTRYERNKARARLAALIKILEPKIHRRDIDSLARELPPRVQFVLTQPLTMVQMAIYQAFVKHAMSDINESTSNARLWGLMDYLQLLCSHPILFDRAIISTRKRLERERLKRGRSPVKRVQQLQDEAGRSPLTDGEETDQSEETVPYGDNDGSVSEDPVALQFAERVRSELDHIFKAVIAAPHEACYSHKISLLLQIVHRSKLERDKVLVFSHRLPTLDFLGEVLEKAGVRCARLDGKTRMDKRQDMTKNFNEAGHHDVFLISTRAGGTGFNLFGANRVVLFDFSFNPTWEEQAIGRAYRFGQSKSVYVYRFISAGTFEDALFNQTIFKLQLAGEVVEKKRTKAKALRTRDYIKPPKQSSLEDFSGQRNNDSVLDSILDDMEGGNELIHEIKLDTTYKEEDQEQLDEEGQREMQELLKQNELRQKNPAEYAKLYGSRFYMPASTAQPDLHNASYNYESYMSAGPSSTAPIAAMRRPADRLPSATMVPPEAQFAPTMQEPHGLPFPMAATLSFDAQAGNGITAFAPHSEPS